MATDYIMFIHGVNTREEKEQPTYADHLFNHLNQTVSNNGRSLKKVALYWGDVGNDAQNDLLNSLKDSEAWNKLWFKEFRAKQLMQFAGDAAVYISRYIGSQVVDRLSQQAKVGLQGFKQNEDSLHLITHSWGTVILFDILFAARWDQSDIAGHQSAQDIRNSLFGVEPNSNKGISLASIYTMGSPIALFSLIDVARSNEKAKAEKELTTDKGNKVNTHDITPRLERLLESLSKIRQGTPLPWRNFIHPGDPVAWPLEKVMLNLVDRESRYLEIKDIVTNNADFSDFLTQPLSQSFLALLHGGDAHGSYWESKQLANEIARTIAQSPKLSVTTEAWE